MVEPFETEDLPSFDTHAVTNQPPPYADVDLYGSDRPLRDAVRVFGSDRDDEGLVEFGRRWGAAEMFDLARQANDQPPRLSIFDARGFRADTVEFHPAYHRLMAESMSAGLHCMTWDEAGRPLPTELARAARYHMVGQVENGHMCPITMTRAAVAALAAAPEVMAQVLPLIRGRRYDARFVPWRDKTAITLGMGMTEKQGGTDVRANTTRALRDGDTYSITGHKWFMSAPMSDAFLVLAQADGGLTCFLMPRFRPDGAVNGLRFQRLKDKLGNRSNASSEVEFVDAFAWRVGEEGRGVRTILRMVQLTRLDCAIASGGLMRAALARALHHARHRAVFGRLLIDQPLMRNLLADMALEVEAATALVMRLCRSFDRGNDPAETARMRLLTPIAKYWVCKIAPGFAYEAMECLGGNGYVEESPLARLYREAPVNAIWEGSGNVICLDVLRGIAREPEAAQAVMTALGRETAALPGAAKLLMEAQAMLRSETAEASARAIVERLAKVAAAAALAASAPAAVADAYARTRLEHPQESLWGSAQFTEIECKLLLERAAGD